MQLRLTSFLHVSTGQKGTGHFGPSLIASELRSPSARFVRACVLDKHHQDLFSLELLFLMVDGALELQFSFSPLFLLLLPYSSSSMKIAKSSHLDLSQPKLLKYVGSTSHRSLNA